MRFALELLKAVFPDSTGVKLVMTIINRADEEIKGAHRIVGYHKLGRLRDRVGTLR